jgi:tripartite-type tricarboxylate transporter receptor subunit TctC
LKEGDTVKNLKISRLLTILGAATLSLGVMSNQANAQTNAPTQAQGYPNKPIKAIVPFAAGSATDQVGRAFAQKMSEILGQPIVVENKAGVNGMLGADAVAKAAPDGYTLRIGTNSTNAALKSLMKKVPYDQDTAFAPVAYMGSVPLIVAVNNDVPVKSLKEFVDMAKAKPTQVTFASASTSQLVSSEM